jgi:hypothetical protein
MDLSNKRYKTDPVQAEKLHADEQGSWRSLSCFSKSYCERTYKFISYLTENTLPFTYEDKLV